MTRTVQYRAVPFHSHLDDPGAIRPSFAGRQAFARSNGPRAPCQVDVLVGGGADVRHRCVVTAAEARTWLLIVHYPLFSRVGQPGVSEYAREHVRRTGRVVAGPMLALAWTGLALVGVIWMNTCLWQVPAHRRLEAGFDAAAHVRLARTNWVRAAAWTTRSVIALALAAAFG